MGIPEKQGLAGPAAWYWQSELPRGRLKASETRPQTASWKEN
jgi:hypothetical protein